MKFRLSWLLAFCIIPVAFYLVKTQAQDPYVSEENATSPNEPEKPEISKRPDPSAQIPKAGSLPQSLIKLSADEYYSPFAFVVDKSTRTLSVWKQAENNFSYVAAYPIDMGKKEGNKQQLGDEKTPEGIYFFEKMLEGSRLNFDEYGSRAFTTNYPNFFDVLERKTGTGIWLHSVPETKSLWRGSKGCIVVRNNVIKELSQYVSLGKTPIVIENKTEYLAPDSFKMTQVQWNNWLDQWKTSWESKSIDSYMNFYGDKFNSLGMNRQAWKVYKQNLSQKYKYINIKVREPNIIVQGDQAIIRFLQVYQSDKNSDFGEKTLYLKKSGDKFQIIAEIWSALGQELLARLEGAQSNHKTQ